MRGLGASYDPKARSTPQQPLGSGRSQIPLQFASKPKILNLRCLNEQAQKLVQVDALEILCNTL